MEIFELSYWVKLLGVPEYLIRFFLAFIISVFVVFISIPKIIRVSYRKHLMDEPGDRSSHLTRIPNLGGVAIYFAISISSSVFAFELFERYKFLYAGLIILFFIGLMDDILVVAPKTKLYAQILVALLISIGSDVRINSFFGLFGVYELPYFLSILFTVIVFIIVSNSYNLIDGIDGLAAMVGIICSSTFIFVFWRLYDYATAILSVAILGSLMCFLYFNLSKKHKIFMGDTGSLVIGFLFSYLAIKFINLCSSTGVDFMTSPVIAISILIVPLIDTLSVIVIRLLNKKSPFQPDKNHIHHRFLKMGLSHVQTSLIITSFNIVFILIAYFFRKMNINSFALLMLLIGLICALIPQFILRYKFSKSDESK